MQEAGSFRPFSFDKIKLFTEKVCMYRYKGGMQDGKKEIDTSTATKRNAKVFADIELREVIYSALQQLKTEYQIILLKYYYQEKLIR